MVGSDRLNVPAISPAVLRNPINARVPFLVGVLHYVKYSEALRLAPWVTCVLVLCCRL